MSTELRKWNREENKAIAEILNGCEPGLRGKLMVDTATVSSAGLWKKLETSFKQPGVGVMLTIRFGILTRFCPEGGSVQEHADLMVSENNKLVGSGLEFDDLTLAAQLLLTLPKSLQAIRQTFLTRPREQLTFESVKAALLAVDHTDRLAGLIRGETQVPTDSSAMYNNGPFAAPRDTPKRPINGMWCDYHRSATHSNADCRQQQSSGSNTPSGKANTAQHKSGKPTKGNAKQNSATRSSNEETETDDDSNDCLFVTLDSELEATALTAATNSALPTGEETVWMIDSASTLHFCHSNEDMVNYRPTSKLFVKVGDGRRLKIAGIGKIRALLQHKGSAPTPVTFHNVHHVPQLTVNLLSVASMDDHGLTVVMGGGKCVIRDQQQRVIGESHRDETRHYRLTTRSQAAPSTYSREHRGWSGKTSAGRGGPIGVSNGILDIFDTNNTSRTSPDPLRVLPNSNQDDDEDDDGNNADEPRHPDAVKPSKDDHLLLPHAPHDRPELLHNSGSRPDHGPGNRTRTGMRGHTSSGGPRDTPSVQLTTRLPSFPRAKHGSAQSTSASDEACKWRDSRQAEMVQDSLLKNSTYSLGPTSGGARATYRLPYQAVKVHRQRRQHFTGRPTRSTTLHRPHRGQTSPHSRAPTTRHHLPVPSLHRRELHRRRRQGPLKKRSHACTQHLARLGLTPA
jgi:hypothetical protein